MDFAAAQRKQSLDARQNGVAEGGSLNHLGDFRCFYVFSALHVSSHSLSRLSLRRVNATLPNPQAIVYDDGTPAAQHRIAVAAKALCKKAVDDNQGGIWFLRGVRRQCPPERPSGWRQRSGG